MSNTTERVAALRKLADDLDVLATLERDYVAAKSAYQADRSDENKEAKRKAASALALARESVRNSPVRDVEPGGMSITPSTVKGA
jgi:hypothetical protein